MCGNSDYGIYSLEWINLPWLWHWCKIRFCNVVMWFRVVSDLPLEPITTVCLVTEFMVLCSNHHLFWHRSCWDSNTYDVSSTLYQFTIYHFAIGILASVFSFCNEVSAPRNIIVELIVFIYIIYMNELEYIYNLLCRNRYQQYTVTIM